MFGIGGAEARDRVREGLDLVRLRFGFPIRYRDTARYLSSPRRGADRTPYWLSVGMTEDAAGYGIGARSLYRWVRRFPSGTLAEYREAGVTWAEFKFCVDTGSLVDPDQVAMLRALRQPPSA